MIKKLLPVIVMLVLLVMPVSGTIVSRTWNQSNTSSALSGCLDSNYNPMTCPDFNATEPWGSMGRVNTSATQYQTMVAVNKFYYKIDNITPSEGIHWMNFSISDVPTTGYTLHPWFSVNGTIIPLQYIGAFEGSTYNVTSASYVGDPASISVASGGDKLSSVAGQKPTSGLGKATLTLPAFRTTAQNRGTGWELQSFNGVSAIQLMYLIEYGDWNSQSVIGGGVTQITDDTITNMAMPTGLTGGVGANSTNLGNYTGQITTVHYQTAQLTYPMSYRGVENLYGNLWKWTDGINIKANNMPWVADHDFASDLFAHPYVDAGLTLPAANGYVSNLAYAAGFDWAFLPSAVAGSSTTYLCDYYYQNTGNRSALFGGSWNHGAAAGAFHWSLYYAASYVSRSVGARVAFTPPLYANFTFDNVTSQAVKFTDTSYNISTKTGALTSPTVWNWSFGNGHVSTSQNPTEAFAVGTYTVNLTASDGTNYATTLKQLKVTAIPVVASFTPYGTTTVITPNGVAFTDTSTGGPTTWLWNFGDGETSALQNPTHVYTKTGVFNVTLTASHTYSSSTASNVTTIKVYSKEPAPGMEPYLGYLTGTTSPIIQAFALAGICIIIGGVALVLHSIYSIVGGGASRGGQMATISIWELVTGIAVVMVGSFMLIVGYAIMSPLITIIGG